MEELGRAPVPHNVSMQAYAVELDLGSDGAQGYLLSTSPSLPGTQISRLIQAGGNILQSSFPHTVWVPSTTATEQFQGDLVKSSMAVVGATLPTRGS